MPHCIIEYSHELAQEVDINALMSAVFQGAVESDLFSIDAIKVRAIAYQKYYSVSSIENNENQQRFIHVCCKILSGRTPSQKQILSNIVLSHMAYFAIGSVSMSVEIVDMERESYNKHLS